MSIVSINKRTLLMAACICLMCGLPLFAVTITVSKTLAAAYTTIQAAVDKSAPGDTVKILDAATYPEQVTVNGSHSGITLTSASPLLPNKPKIVWQDKVNEGPKTCLQAQVDSLITFDQNGALRLMRTHNVTVNGIIVDGGGVMPFGSTENVWPPAGGSKSNCQYPLVHGNTAIVLWIAGDITIKNCEAQNAYFGIYLKDRNEGGIFANANPGDNAPWNVVPLSGFAQTGNHIIEYTRIHDNSYGFFIESAWDLGSTIRYNLIYENHHPTAALAAQVKALNSEGSNQPGAAMFFKDDMLSPLSIYNNTFWHNYLIFCGGWQAGYQHLVFNNIFAHPFMYWSVVPVFSGLSYMDITSVMPNRITNCVYSCQNQAPATGYVSIMNGLPSVQGVGGAQPLPGAVISTNTANQAFPAAANNRWLEMDTAFFISVNPASANFLEPNWTDPNVQSVIVNKGWQKSSVKNIDGSWADIGAISSIGGRPASEAVIRPTMPVLLTGNVATVNFSLTERAGRLQNPSVKFFRWISNLQFVAGSWAGGAAAAVINTANINDVVPIPTPVQVGANTYTITVPAAQTSPYAFFEGIIEGAGTDGRLYTTSTGFLPFRKLDYKFKVEVFAMTDITYAKPLTQVMVGDSVIVRITPLKADGTTFTNKVDSVKVRLQSSFKFLVPSFRVNQDTAEYLLYPNGVTGPTNKIAMFTGVPSGGIEYLYANGVWISTTDTTQRKAFPGTSSGIKILPGPPANVVFQDPPSKRFGIPPPKLNPGQPYSGNLFVYDLFGNKVNAPASVTLTSLTPSVAAFGSPTITTDSTGTGNFTVSATSNSTEGTPITLQALLTTTGNADTAFMTVGKRQEYLFIFYSDTNQYNAATRLEGQVGDRLAVTIIATKAAIDTMSIRTVATARNDTFTVSGSSTPGLAFYSSATATTQAASFNLVNGRATVWVSSADTMSNGYISATTMTIGNSSPRYQIFFSRPTVAVDSAFYYARYGSGAVDSVDIYYRVKLNMVPDSITLFWPGADADKRVIPGSQMKLSADSQHITIVLAAPFAREITVSSAAGSKQGISYNRPNSNPGVPESASSFAITDRVGPLIMSAQVVERLTAGTIDTLYVAFSEPIQASTLTGSALLLIKNGNPSTLSISAASSMGNNRFKLAVTGTSAPQLGDSLRINPAGPIADVLNNTANLLNRPVVITLKPIPAAIVQAWYLDKNADGIVDAVDIKFNKNVSLSDVVVSLDWGNSNRADSIPASLLSFSGTDNLSIEISVRGAFNGLTADSIKTSGSMNATVGYRSMPFDPTSTADVADSAAPVIISAKYYPSPNTNGIDTLLVRFSEPVTSISSTTPFSLYSKNFQKSYSLVVDRTDHPEKFTNTALGQYSITSVQGVQFPVTGDSIWIDPAAGIGDAGLAVQKNPNNRRALMDVAPVPYAWKPLIVRNPFSIGVPVSDGGVSGTGTIIEVPLPVRMADISPPSATGRIYDALGNTVVEEFSFKPNSSTNKLYYNWDGRNLNSRYVGTGTYVAVVTVTQTNASGSINSTKKLTIGVKR